MKIIIDNGISLIPRVSAGIFQQWESSDSFSFSSPLPPSPPDVMGTGHLRGTIVPIRHQSPRRMGTKSLMATVTPLARETLIAMETLMARDPLMVTRLPMDITVITLLWNLCSHTLRLPPPPPNKWVSIKTTFISSLHSDHTVSSFDDNIKNNCHMWSYPLAKCRADTLTATMASTPDPRLPPLSRWASTSTWEHILSQYQELTGICRILTLTPTHVGTHRPEVMTMPMTHRLKYPLTFRCHKSRSKLWNLEQTILDKLQPLFSTHSQIVLGTSHSTWHLSLFTSASGIFWTFCGGLRGWVTVLGWDGVIIYWKSQCWDCHVSFDLWSNVTKVTSL